MMRIRLSIAALTFFFIQQATAQFHGGTADGVTIFSSAGKNPLPAIYSGGDNDGEVYLAAVNQNPLINIYSGGINDGVVLSTAPAQNPLAVIYTGGNNDGIAAATTSSQNIFPEIYAGGNNDGFSFLLSANKNPYLNIFTGGGNDGWASLQLNGVNPFTTLAVQLLAFNGNWQQNDIILNWKTVTETANDHFEIERSTDGGRHYESIGSVAGAINSSTIKTYSFTDRDAGLNTIPVLYYRLKIADITGHFIYSAVIQFKINFKEATYTLFPNPGSGKFQLQINSRGRIEGFSYQIVTTAGNAVKKGIINTATTSFDISDLASGIYWMQIITDKEKSQVISIIINH
jgi:hypothetical protein